MKHLLITASLLVATATPALANKTAVSEARIDDHYKIVIEQSPYQVEICKNVQVPTKGADTLNTEGAIIGGFIGGVIGNQRRGPLSLSLSLSLSFSFSLFLSLSLCV